MQVSPTFKSLTCSIMRHPWDGRGWLRILTQSLSGSSSCRMLKNKVGQQKSNGTPIEVDWSLLIFGDQLNVIN
jgi:hypothetical protein